MVRVLGIFALVSVLTASTLAQSGAIDSRVASLVAAVSEERLQQVVQRLQSFETRHSLSSTTSATRGIGAARSWMLDEMTRASSRLQVAFDTYRIPPQGARIPREVEIANVMAVLPGRTPRRLYVSAHYDSVAPAPPASDPTVRDSLAPGANDDGSGTAVVMELARVFGQSGIEFDATLVFIAFAGEEEGLVGAKLHAQHADAAGVQVDAVVNNDIVGNMVGGNGLVDSESVRVFSEGPEDSPSRQLARYIKRHAARYGPSHRVRLIARPDRFGRGGDHTAFNQHGFAAVRITEANENFARQHTEADTADGLSPPYLARNARVNAAAIATLALAPPAPQIARLNRGNGYDAHLVWNASPGATSYRVFWREAWTPDWEHELDVGNVTALTVPNLPIDDFVFGVAAVGAGGHESLVSAYVNPPRARVDIKTLP